MICGNCKNEVKDESNYCPLCGNKLINIENNTTVIQTEKYSYFKLVLVFFLIILIFSLFGVKFLNSLYVSIFFQLYMITLFESYLKKMHMISQTFSLNNFFMKWNNYSIRPKLIILLILHSLLLYVIGVDIFLTIIIIIISTIFMFLKFEIFLQRDNFIRESFSIKAKFKNKNIKNRIMVSLGIIILFLLYFYMKTTEYYHDYIFRSRVDEFIELGNEDELSKIFYSINYRKESDSLNYLIISSHRNYRSYLMDIIESYFWMFPSNLQDSLINIHVINKTPFLTENYVCKELMNNNIVVKNQKLKKIIDTHSPQIISKNIGYQISRSITKIDSLNPDIYRLRKLVYGYIKYFNLNNDTIWSGVNNNIFKIDSLQKYITSIDSEMPEKPTYEKPDYNPPVYINGGVIPFDGAGVLVYTFDDGKFKLIQGAFRDPYPMFSGYAYFTGNTTTVYSKVNGRTWDAYVYTYVSADEYENIRKEYQERLLSSKNYYNEELALYKKQLGEYQFYIKMKPIIDKQIMSLVSNTKSLINIFLLLNFRRL